MISFINGFINGSLPIRGPSKMHIIHEYESFSSSCKISFKHGDDFLIDSFMLGIADWVFARVSLFTVFIETKGARSDIEVWRDLRDEAVA